MEIEGSAGAGMVSVTLSGKGELKSVRIDPKLIDPNETEMLQDLMVAAHAEARRKMRGGGGRGDAEAVTGGLELPPGMKLPF